VVKPAPGLNFASKPDVRLGSMLSKKSPFSFGDILGPSKGWSRWAAI
jgi:hypothetical protein